MCFCLRDSNNKAKEVAIIAIGVAVIIGGGMGIFVISTVFPIPGVKYLLMSPYLSMAIHTILCKSKSKLTLLKLGTVFAMIMTTINLLMEIAIFLTTIFTHISVKPIKKFDQGVFWSSVLFSAYMPIFALAMARVAIGEIAYGISNWWLLLIGLFSAVFGVLGANFSKVIFKHRF